MKKLLKTALCIIISAAFLMACGKKEASFDVADLGEELASGITYSDQPSLLDLDTAGMFLNLSDINVVNSAIYEGSGATAEEIVVLECASEDDAKNAETALKQRVEEQKESFTDYVPEELTKLDSAVIKVNGKYAVLSVSDDPKGATSIIEKYM